MIIVGGMEARGAVAPAAPPVLREDAGGEPVTVLLVDDHPLYRWGVRALLERHGAEVVAEAACVDEAAGAVVRERPRVVLMDLRLQGESGIDAIRRIADLDPEARIVVLSVSADPRDVLDAVAAGACGYLVKGGPREDLTAAIAAAARGQDPISPAVARALLARVRAGRADAEAVERIRSRLTAREAQILRMMAGGRSIAEIARDLDISPKTARNHLSNLFGKLGVANRVQATLWAVRAGLLDEPPDDP